MLRDHFPFVRCVAEVLHDAPRPMSINQLSRALPGYARGTVAQGVHRLQRAGFAGEAGKRPSSRAGLYVPQKLWTLTERGRDAVSRYREAA